jgi:hypothetical protein
MDEKKKNEPKKKNVEQVVKLDVKRESGYLYFIRGSEVWRSPMRGGGEASLVAKGEFKRESGYLYFLDSKGNISRSPMASKKAEGSSPAKGQSKPAKTESKAEAPAPVKEPTKAAPKKVPKK